MGYLMRADLLRSLLAILGGLLLGQEVASVSGIPAIRAYQNAFNHPTAIAQGCITASMPLAALLGVVCMGIPFLNCMMSSKFAIQLSCLLWLVGSSLQAAANSMAMLIVGRAVGGFALGVAAMALLTYEQYIVPSGQRGRISAIRYFVATLTMLIGYLLQYGVISAGKDVSQLAFRIPWALQTIPAILLLTVITIAPQPPQWLGMNDRWQDVKQVMAYFHSLEEDIRNPRILALCRKLQLSLQAEPSTKATKQDPFLIKKIVFSLSVQIWSALSGIRVFLYYAIYVMQNGQIKESLLATAIIYITYSFVTIIALYYIDRWRRRSMFLVGCLGMGIFLLLIGALQTTIKNPSLAFNLESATSTKNSQEHQATTIGIVTCSVAFVAFHGLTLGPLSWIYPSEILYDPESTSHLSRLITIGTTWFLNGALAIVVPVMLQHLPWTTFVIFGACNILACIHMYCFLPETKDLTLEQLHGIFEGKKWFSPYGLHRQVKVADEDEFLKLKKLFLSPPEVWAQHPQDPDWGERDEPYIRQHNDILWKQAQL